MRKMFYSSSAIAWERRPWLVLGKGPTIDRYAVTDVSKYNVLALNHTVTMGPCEIAHAIDMEVIDDCGKAITRNAKYLFMPERPHVGMKQGQPIEDHIPRNRFLGIMENENRLVVYKKYVSAARTAPPGVIPVMYFSRSEERRVGKECRL